MEEKNVVISTTSPWFAESRMGSIDEEDLELIRRLGKRFVYPAGTYIHFDGSIVDSFQYIDEGLVRYFIANSDGVEKTVYYTDRFVAIECFIHEQPVHTNCVVEEDVVLYRVDRAYKEELLSRKSIRDLVFQALALKCRILGWQIDDLCLAKPMQKIARILCCYYFDENTNDNHSLLNQEIADMTGLHRVTVSNYINELRKAGILEQDSLKRWFVKDKELLQELAFEDTCIYF